MVSVFHKSLRQVYSRNTNWWRICCIDIVACYEYTSLENYQRLPDFYSRKCCSFYSIFKSCTHLNVEVRDFWASISKIAMIDRILPISFWFRLIQIKHNLKYKLVKPCETVLSGENGWELVVSMRWQVWDMTRCDEIRWDGVDSKRWLFSTENRIEFLYCSFLFPTKLKHN